MIEPGKILQQRYRIEKQIGQGGMGAVYVATDERFGSVVAIKETLCMDDNFRKAIEREARLLNSLKHTALPRVSDHFEEDNILFLVMEYIPGEDVGTMLENNRAFTVEQVLKWADQLLDALDYLHTQEMPVIHRDIKPQNLKLNSRGEMILLDFGLAKGNPTDAGHHTAAKSIFGYSRNYASLEQIQGTGTDPRSDLYSLAATLYHLLTRTAPEDALTRAMSVLSQRPDPLKPASALNTAVPKGVAGVLLSALDLNAGGRPSSADDMRQMLRNSDAYAHLVQDAGAAATVPDARVFAQPTQLMPETTFANAGKLTDAKTEVLPAFSSEATALSSRITDGSGSDAPRKRSRFAVAGGVMSLLLVGAAIGGGLYVVDPSFFGVEELPQNAEPVRVETNVAAGGGSQPISAETPSPETGAEASVAPEKLPSTSTTTTTSPATKAPETTTAKTAKARKDRTKAGTDDGTDDEGISVNVDDPDFKENFVITSRGENGKTTTMRVNPKVPQQPRVPPGGQDFFKMFPPGADLNRMTPAQRQKLMRIMKNNQRRVDSATRPTNIPPQPE